MTTPEDYESILDLAVDEIMNAKEDDKMDRLRNVLRPEYLYIDEATPQEVLLLAIQISLT